jgi:hypothetical protein
MSQDTLYVASVVQIDVEADVQAGVDLEASVVDAAPALSADEVP